MTLCAYGSRRHWLPYFKSQQANTRAQYRAQIGDDHYSDYVTSTDCRVDKPASVSFSITNNDEEANHYRNPFDDDGLCFFL
jgi:hypothetical protein